MKLIHAIAAGALCAGGLPTAWADTVVSDPARIVLDAPVVDIENGASVKGWLNVEGTLTSNGLLNEGDATITRNLSVGGDLDVDGEARANGLRSTGGLRADGDTALGGALRVGGDSELAGGLRVGGAAALDGGLQVRGDTLLGGNLRTAGNAAVDGDMRVRGNTVLEGDLLTHGTAHIAGDALVGGDMVVGGQTSTSGIRNRGTLDNAGLVATDSLLVRGGPQTTLRSDANGTRITAGGSAIDVAPQALTLTGGSQGSQLRLDASGARFAGADGQPVRVTGVADGVDPTDAVNRGQVKAMLQEIENKANAGIAGIAALASIPGPMPDDRFSIGMGYGNHLGAEAVAIAVKAAVSPSVRIAAGLAHSAAGPTVSVGMGYSWK